MPIRQSNVVGKNSCATTRSESSNRIFELFLELGLVADFDHAAGERAVGLLEHAGKAQLAGGVDLVLGMEHNRFGDLDVVPAEQFGQVDLVRAADDRLRIVDHDQAFARSPAGKTIRVMVDGRRFADEQSVELGDPPVIDPA